MDKTRVAADRFFEENLAERSDETSRGAILRFGRSILRAESRAIRAAELALDGEFGEAVEAILACRGMVILSGMGKAGLIGQKIAATLASTGTPSQFLHPAEAIHGDLGRIRPDDLLLILSYSGKTEEILRILPSLEEFGTPVISMTQAASPLAERSDILLKLADRPEADPMSPAPSNSTAVMLALGDALALTVSRLRGFRAEDFARFHPGGNLGRKLSPVEEKMRPLSECRVSAESRTVREIFIESRIPGRRSGAILLTNVAGRLSGIFTDSDLAKLFERKDDSALDRPAAELMTKSPKTVHVGTRMADAVALMGRNKISELPVLDASGVPVGLLDVTDLVPFFPDFPK